jgi:ABC-type antimicrobial peptide transport system permease subunit
MIRPESLRVGMRTLRANPLRTLLSTLGVIMGVGSMVSVLAMGDGVERYAREQVERTTDLQAIALTPNIVQRIDGILERRTDGIFVSDCLMFGLYPALRAARRSPIDAIRHE